MAILIDPMPSGVQDHVISQMSKDANFDEVADIIKRYASRKAEASGPTPMDVRGMSSGPAATDTGGMSGQYDEYDQQQYEQSWCSTESDWWSADDGETDVNGVSDAICYNCGGKGRLSTSCPSPSKGKSKGKGGKG